MKGFVIHALVDTDEKVRRWAFNSLAQLGEAADVALIIQPWKDNRAVAPVFEAGLTTLAHLVQKEHLLRILRSADVDLDAGALMALGQQTEDFIEELRALRVDLGRATDSELRQATLLIGLKKAPDTLFSGRHPVSDVIGDLNSHGDPVVAQYSFWATVEHPDLGLANIRIKPSNFPALPPNVQGWAYRVLTKDGAVTAEHYDCVIEGAKNPNEEVREGVALGLRNLFYADLDVTVTDWLIEERCPEVRGALLEHMATHVSKSAAYREEVLRAYKEAGPRSVLRTRLEAANSDASVSLEMRRISLQMDDPLLFASMTGSQMSQNFYGDVNAGGISMMGTGNTGSVQIISPTEAQAAVLPILKELIQKLESSSAPAGSGEGARIAKEAAATPTRGKVASLIDWLKRAKDGGDAIAGISSLASSAYDKLLPYLSHLPDLIA